MTALEARIARLQLDHRAASAAVDATVRVLRESLPFEEGQPSGWSNEALFEALRNSHAFAACTKAMHDAAHALAIAMDEAAKAPAEVAS